MAYYSGSAASFSDLKTAIENACLIEGWTLLDGILSKDGCYIKLEAVTARIVVSCGNGQNGTSLTDACSKTVKIYDPTNASAIAIIWPINYEIHIFDNPNEVYCVVNYNSDFYQQISFGQSSTPGLTGSGNWFSASSGGAVSETFSTSSTMAGFSSSTNWRVGRNVSNSAFIAGFPFNCSEAQSQIHNQAFIHSDFDSSGWNDTYGTSVGNLTGPYYCSSIISSSPNLFNESSVLIPVKAVVVRPSFGLTIAAQLKNIRFLRIDNLNPGDLITLGSEQWKVYPLYRKNSSIRDFESSRETHSGTYGVAILYTGV